MKEYTKKFEKQLQKLSGQQLLNIRNKIEEILNTPINHFKNLQHNLSQYKRVHVNKSFVILFYREGNITYFVEYDHHDVIYKKHKYK